MTTSALLPGYQIDSVAPTNIYLKKQLLQKGEISLSTKVLIILVAAILLWFTTEPIRERVASWFGAKTKVELITENTQLKTDLTLTLQATKDNQAEEKKTADAGKAAEAVMVNEIKTVEKIKTARKAAAKDTDKKIEVIRADPQLTTTQKQEAQAKVVIESIWTAYYETSGAPREIN